MEFFYHPWYMAAGGVLISSPILIHLINRMRFKRVRWAAMEFLLKSQKRNRRKLIVEQLILLLLRILLVLLAAFLVARFVYGSGVTRGAMHVVVVDDTLSLNDRSRENNKETIAYETGIEQIKDLARNAAQASSAQFMKVVLLSEIDKTPMYEGRLSDRTPEDLDQRFAVKQRKPSLLHVSPLKGLTEGEKLLQDERNEGQKILHFVSDFRDRDWTAGQDAEKVVEKVKSLLSNGVNVNLIDVGYPRRNAKSKTVTANNNLALVDLKSETRVATEDTDIEFTATIANNGTAKEKTFLEVFINGEHDLTRDQMIEDIEPGKTKEYKFTLRFARRARPGTVITDKDSVEDRERKRRLDRDQFHVRVIIGKEDNALNADNVRDVVLEVRRKVPTLVIDGTRPEFKVDGSDMYLMQAFYAASGTYEIEERRLADLDKADLDLYPAVILMNVAELTPPLVAKLKSYVERGGSVCWFMGEEVKPDHYNSVLYPAGLMPLTVQPQFHDPLFAAGIVDAEKRKAERTRLALSPTPKVLFPNREAVAVRQLAYPGFSLVFRALGINVYWKAESRSKWDPDGRKVEQLIVLPNNSSVDVYKGRAVSLARQAVSQARKLADNEAAFKAYIPVLEQHERDATVALARQDLYTLGMVLEDMLSNPGESGNAAKPAMAALWKAEDMRTLAGDIREFRDTVLYGDPLLVSKQVGKGRVTAFLTTAGADPRRGVSEDRVQWNNWGTGVNLVQDTYSLLLLDLHRFLISEGESSSRLVGDEVSFAVDATRFAPKCTVAYTRQPDVSAERPDKIKPVLEKDVSLTKEGSLLKFSLRGVTPGVHRVNLSLLGDGGEESRSFAFNVDAANESDLRRASRERLVPEDMPTGDSKMGKLTLHIPGDTLDPYKERQPDASESSLLYLFFILILVVEQAMAVHLSYHAKGNEQSSPSASPVPAAA